MVRFKPWSACHREEGVGLRMKPAQSKTKPKDGKKHIFEHFNQPCSQSASYNFQIYEPIRIFLCFCLKQFRKFSITWSQKNPDERTSSLVSLKHVSCEWHFLFFPQPRFSSLLAQACPNLCNETKDHILCIKGQENVLFFYNISLCFCPRLSLGSEYGISWMIFLLQMASTVVTWRCSADGCPGPDSPRWLMPGISVGMAARLVQLGAFPLFLGLLYMFFYAGSGLHEWVFQEVLDVSCKTSYNLDLEIQGCYFYLILMVKQVTKANPDSRGKRIKQLDFIFQWEE